MATLYTRTADRRRLVIDAIDKLNVEATSIPSPSQKVRAKSPKAK
jgi:hypothetical protein